MSKSKLWGISTSCVIIASIVFVGLGTPVNSIAAPSIVSSSLSLAPRLLSTNAGYASVVDMAVSMSYPIYEDGKKADPRSTIPGGPTDKDRASALYKELKYSAWEKSVKYGSSLPAWPGESYANCSAYTATAIINMVDPTYPGNFTSSQRDYVGDRSNGWYKVADTELGYDRDALKPGDIFLSKPKVGVMWHTWMWIGSLEGRKNIVSQASYGGVGTSAQLPALQIDPILVAGKYDGTDRLGRSYDVWRYSGAAKSLGSKIGMTDTNNDENPDVFAMHQSTGELLYYSGKGNGGLSSSTKLGTQWKGLRLVTPGDFNGDGRDDLIAVNEKSGQLYLYEGEPDGTFGGPKQIGRGFQTIRSLFSSGDFNGDGFPDLIGIHKTSNTLQMWPGTGKGGLSPNQQIGTGWGNMEVASGGNMNGDGKSDILAKSNAGTLYLYPGNGSGKLMSRVNLGSGWKNRTFMSPGDLDRDGFGDVVYRDNGTGYLYIARGSRGGKIKSDTRIGTGWNTLEQVI